MRIARAALLALALAATGATAPAQTYCWDTVCAAGTPAADCWRAWCVDGWSYPAYPYRAPTWYRSDPAWQGFAGTDRPIFPATNRTDACSGGRTLSNVVAWGC